MENAVEDILCAQPPKQLFELGTDAGGRLLWPEMLSEEHRVQKRPRRQVYAKRILFNGVNAALLVAAFLSSVAFTSMAPLATFLGVQVVLAFMAPRLAWVRNMVNAGIEAENEAELARHRSMTLMQMSEKDRHVFEGLEIMVRRIRNESMTPNGKPRALISVYLEVERLLATYATLALIHRRTYDHLMLGAANVRSGPAPDHDPGRIVRPSSLNSVIARRNEIQRKRRAVRECNQERLLTMEQQMGAIHDLVCLVYEHVATDTVGESVMSEIEDVLKELSHTETSSAEHARAEWTSSDEDRKRAREASPTDTTTVRALNRVPAPGTGPGPRPASNGHPGTYRAQHPVTPVGTPHARV